LATARSLLADVGGASRLLVADPGCARALLVEYPRVGVSVGESAGGEAPGPRPELLLDLAAASSRIGALRDPARVRWHDPCQLGRGLGRYDEPRALLRRLTGTPPEEFLYQREHAACSGAGGVLPSTRPESSKQIADERIADHRARGGGTLVTNCAASLRRFRDRGEPAEDLFSLVERGLALEDGAARLTDPDRKGS
jgi:Fe-S oxidoreductase